MQLMYSRYSEANSADEVLQLTRDFVAGLSNDDLAGLPADCRPARVDGRQDIEVWADRLYHAAANAYFVIEEDERKLDSLASHFLIASIRLQQIDRHAPAVA